MRTLQAFGHTSGWFPTRHRMTAAFRATQRLAWTRTALADPELELQRASADASFRSYWRTRSGGESWIVMDAPPEHEDIAPWLDIARRLFAAGLHAPEVRSADLEHGFVLMSDLGDALYLPALDTAHVDVLYSDAMDALLRMQAGIDASDLPAYDEARL
ncbi:MAG TPA: aminoglycoside phosphotransferase, partial [Arenimonas sp.]|nr:aminoglycoside phosphotransferase [Arenimonas sp.]